VFGHQNITQVKNGVGEVVYRTTIEEGLYEPAADYTKMAL
jgi:branched-chain amino acid transport system substrate-binding protein